MQERGVPDPQYVEAVLAWSEAGADPEVEHWLAGRGLRVQPMRGGLLVTGDSAAYQAAFGVDVAQASLPARLDVPPELGAAVSSVTLPAPRRISP